MTQSIRTICGAALLALSFVEPVQAADLPPVTGDVILTVTGEIGVTNADDAAEFDLAALQSLPLTEFVTSTIWTEGESRFSGVALSDLMAALRVTTGTLTATAINDYMISFPVPEALTDDALVAFAVDGNPMSVRDKGPLWIVYPYDGNSKYQSEEYYSRSIWQLDRIEILKD